MQERERDVITGLVILMLILWGGFLVHRSPEFAGSLTGFILGSMAALLIFIPLLYMIIKRIKPLKKSVTQTMRMPTLLSWHIYAGILGPILALLHTGHRFESPLGIGLTVLMLITVLSGFIGRYLMSQFSAEIRDKQKLRDNLRHEYDKAATELCCNTSYNYLTSLIERRFSLLPIMAFASIDHSESDKKCSKLILQLTDAISDVEYSIKIHESIKQWFKRWLKFHIVISLVLYVLLVFHIGAEIYFGLRWL